MFIEERHREILKLLEEKGSIGTALIQRRFGLSYESAKRDLRILEEKGLLKRTHGGALPLRQTAAGRPPKLTCKDIPSVKENYLSIALKAVSMIEDNDVVFITSATVGYLMTQNIPAYKRFRAIVNSIVIAEELRKLDNVSVILLGGEMDDRGNLYDAFAVEMLRRLRMDKCFVTAASISSEFGLSIQKSQSITFMNTLLDSSKKAIGLFPTEKLGFESVVSICPVSRIDLLITDWDASEEELEKLDEAGVEVIITERDGEAEEELTETQKDTPEAN